MKKITNRLISYFLQGIIVVIPLVVVVLAGKYLFDLLVSYKILNNPWLTLVVILTSVILVGIMARSIFVRPFFNWFEEILTRPPILKFVYTSIKDLMEAFVGEKKRFTRPVVIDLIHETALQRFGFLTTDDLEKMGPGFEGKVTVYVPMSYSVSGNLFIVPADRVTPLPDVDPAELMKFILAGGVTDLDDVLKEGKVGEVPNDDAKPS